MNDKIVAINTARILDAKDVLEDAIAENFETVIVFGFKDGNISWKKSWHVRTVEILGALEMAKRVLFDTQEEP
jgi:hypothetical protein